MKTYEEIKAKIKEMVNNPIEHNYKERALKEIKLIKAKWWNCSNIEAIVDAYPDFNSVTVRVTLPNVMDISLHFSYEFLNESEQNIDAVCMILKQYQDMGGILN